MSAGSLIEREYYEKFGPGGARRGEAKASSMTIREAFAMAALQGLLANGGSHDKPKSAVAYADGLLARLSE